MFRHFEGQISCFIECIPFKQSLFDYYFMATITVSIIIWLLLLLLFYDYYYCYYYILQAKTT